MKKTLLYLFILNSSCSWASGIPVFDASANVQAIKEWTEELQQWGETAQHYQNQLEAYKKQLETATGIRNIGDFTNALKSIQSELDGIYKEGESYTGVFTENPEGALSPKAEAVFEKYGAFDMCKTGVQQSDNLCKARVVTKASNIEQTRKLNEDLSKSMDKINTLSSRIEKSKDIKESQDLANALQAQAIKMEAITKQYEIVERKNKADAEMLDEQRVSAFLKQQKEAKTPKFNTTLPQR